MQAQNPDWDEIVADTVSELEQDGIVETYYDDNGEKTIRLTTKGVSIAQELNVYKYN
ncbi:hypothetical protein MK292_02515 [Myxococcota bacterium]|nr:hypothetical protein [Myxococcota bacterium]|tara:strand:+ start:576 stop:746 length:171 start_codon:yes stop_codon:yes gene_type:complete